MPNPCHSANVSSRTKRRDVRVPKIPRRSGRVRSGLCVNGPKATYNPIRNQIFARDQIKRIVDGHPCFSLLGHSSLSNAETGLLIALISEDQWHKLSSSLSPRGVTSRPDVETRPTMGDWVLNRLRLLSGLTDPVQPMPSSLSSKNKGYSKLESDLPTHVRSTQTYGTAHPSSRVRQGAIVVAWVGIVLLFSGFYRGYSIHYSQGGIRNPAYLVKARSGAVASENILCSEIGVEAMKDGGNAVDAAIATTFCTGVVNIFS